VKLRVKNLYKVFGANPEKGVDAARKGMGKEEIMARHKLALGVNDVSFEVGAAEILVIMGLSGSGKSTLVRCINRLIEPTAGTVEIDGIDVTKLSERELRLLRMQKVGMVFQNFALFPHRTVQKNVEYGLEIQEVPVAERAEKARQAIDLVGLSGWEDYKPENLSGGMQQRVGLARALASGADVLLMDEAFSALDPLIKREMQDELLALQARVGKTIIFITHDLDEALKLGDRIIIMKDGRAVQVGTPEEILTNPANEYVEKFVQDVDITKVLTVSKVMRKAVSVTFPKDGPKTAMRKMHEEGFSQLMVVGKDRKIIGMVEVEAVMEAIKRGEHTLEHIIDRDVTTVQPDDNVGCLFPVKKYPIAVVNPENKLLGIVKRGSLLSGIADFGGTYGNQ
jgi:glycine betaine/proline transport system ATP-binding protein